MRPISDLPVKMIVGNGERKRATIILTGEILRKRENEKRFIKMRLNLYLKSDYSKLSSETTKESSDSDSDPE